MLTVVAIDESLMREIGEFEPLLTSVEDRGQYKICGWRRNETTLQKAIPALFDRDFITEGELLEWNILIVSDNRGCFAHNPFEGVYVPGSDSPDLRDAQLNELAKMLGVIPVSSEFVNRTENEENGKVTWEIKVDKTSRDQKLADYYIKDFTRPNRIYLMSVQKEFDVDVVDDSNNTRIALDHPHFSTDGLYPPNCRFFKFNLSSKSNKITATDYFRLWMSVLCFAYNDDADELYFQADTLYSMDSVINKRAVKKQINEVYSRVHAARNIIEARLKAIYQLRQFNSSKNYRLPIFNSDIKVEYVTDEHGLYLDEKRFGLTKDCPVLDDHTYASQRTLIEKRIKEYLKVPQRAVRKAVKETKQQGVYQVSEDGFIYLNREQREDLDEGIDTTEFELFNSTDVDINYPKQNALDREDADKRSYKEMKKRSPKWTVIISSIIILAVFALSFLPYILGKTVGQRSTESYIYSLLVTLGGALVLALSGFITLLFLKRPLKHALFHFRKVIDALVAFVKRQTEVYSKYLSKLSNYMQMNSFRRYVDSNAEDYLREDENKLVLNKAYCCDMEKLCKIWAANLEFELKYDDSYQNVLIDLDNKPEQNSVFSFVSSKEEFSLDYNRKKSRLSSPYPFVSSLNICGEEVYE